MASAQIVETSVANNSPSQDSNHPDDLFQSRYVTPGFKSFSYDLYRSLFKPIANLNISERISCQTNLPTTCCACPKVSPVDPQAQTTNDRKLFSEINPQVIGDPESPETPIQPEYE